MTPVTDPERIAKVLKHPAIWPHISDDYTPDGWMPAPSESRFYLMPDDDSACFVFSHHSGAMVEGHLAVLPEARKRGVDLAWQALAWMRANTIARVAIGFIKADNLPARLYVERVGFVRSAIVPGASMKDDRQSDLVFYMKDL